MKKSVKHACHAANSNNALDSLPTLQISLGIIALFERIYDGEPIVTVISNIGEYVKYRCFNKVYDVKRVTQPDTTCSAQTRTEMGHLRKPPGVELIPAVD